MSLSAPSIPHKAFQSTLRWGWFIACRCGCGAEAFVPALVSSGCQTATGMRLASLCLPADSSSFQHSPI